MGALGRAHRRRRLRSRPAPVTWPLPSRLRAGGLVPTSTYSRVGDLRQGPGRGPESGAVSRTGQVPAEARSTDRGRACRRGSSDARAAVHHRIPWRRPAAGGAGVGVEGSRSGGPSVRATRLPRLDRLLGDPLHAHRARAAQDRVSHADPAHTRAAAPAGAGHGRHPVRHAAGGRQGLRRPRGGRLPADRRPLDGRGDGDRVRPRELLPGHAAVCPPRPTTDVTAGTGARGGRQPDPLGRGRAALERHLARRPQRPSGVGGPGPRRGRARPRLHRPALAGRGRGAGALARPR